MKDFSYATKKPCVEGYSCKLSRAVFYLLLYAFGMLTNSARAQYTRYVNPFIGTGGHGHTFPGAVQPFGMVALSPDTRVDGSWDGCSGYHFSDSNIYGFSHTHLSGTGCSDLGDIAFLPITLNGKTDAIFNYLEDTLRVGFSHQEEKAWPGYYSVKMANNILVELTASERVGFQKYTMMDAGETWIVLNLKHRDQLLEGKITKLNNHTYKGLRRSKAWAVNQLVFYYFELSADPDEAFIARDENGNDAKLYMKYANMAGRSVLIKTAISSVSESGAEMNLNAEIPHWDFEKVKSASDAQWNKELGTIALKEVLKSQIDTEEKDKLTIFYTALYHCFIHPSIYNDVDHRYRGRDGKIYVADGFNYYSVFSLWDTYRALHPLFNIIQRKRNLDFIKTFLAHYDQVGRLPIWELWGNETDCMIGYHAVSVINDAYNKGIRDFDIKKASLAMMSIANSSWRGIDIYKRKGYLEVDDEPESVSKTLEYSYNDWCIGKFLNETGNRQAAVAFAGRAYNSLNLYNPATGFIQPRKNGGWLKLFEPSEVNNHYTEANGWQYNFYTPHIPELMSVKLLNNIFSADNKLKGRQQSDITGLIGQYAHGNEPSHHIAFLLARYGLEKKGDSIINYIRNNFYKNAPDGLIGNEDCGQMSAWYIWAALGKYPVTPGESKYGYCTPIYYQPLFDSLPRFAKQKKIYKQKNNLFAVIVDNSEEIFKDSILFAIQNYTNKPNVKVKLTYDKAFKPDSNFKYTKPFWIDRSASVETFSGGNISAKSVTKYHKIPNNYTITLASKPNSQYTAGGADALIDGLRGDAEWRKGKWQGYQYQDFQCVVNLQKLQQIHRVSLGCLQDSRSWILMPKQVTVAYSLDGVNFMSLGSQIVDQSDSSDEVVIKDYQIDFTPVQAKYIRVTATNYGKLPAWHQGWGDSAFIFVDEINIE